MKNSNRLGAVVGIGIVTAILVFVLLGRPGDLAPRVRLLEDGRSIYGTVVAKEPSNHQGVRYEFALDGRAYGGVGQAGRSTGPFEQITIGQIVAVTYLADDPRVSVLHDSVGDVVSDAGSLLVLSLFGGAVAASSVASLLLKGPRPDAAAGADLVATLADRLVAYAIDAALVGVVFGVLAFNVLDDPVVMIATGNLLYGAYFVLSWSSIGGGRTIGMRLRGLRVVAADGTKVGPGRALVRYVALYISFLLLGLPLIRADSQGRWWHDRVANTLVIRELEHATTGA